MTKPTPTSKKHLIRSFINHWNDEGTMPSGTPIYTLPIDNYTDVIFSTTLKYFGKHPPEVKENTKYGAIIKQHEQGYYILINSSQKTGPLYFEEMGKSKPKPAIEEHIVGLMEVEGIGEKTATQLVNDNIKTVKALSVISLHDLTQYEGIGKATAEKIKKSAATIVGGPTIMTVAPDKINKEIPEKTRKALQDNPHNIVPYDPAPDNELDFNLFDTDKLASDIVTSVSLGSKNSMDYKVKGRTLRSSQMGKDHAYVFLDTYYYELPEAWQASVRDIVSNQYDKNLGNTTPGTAAHEYFQVAMDAIARKYQEVQLLSHELPLVADYGDFRSKGHYDGLLRVKDTNGQYQLMLMDIKTTGGKWYDLMIKNFEKKKEVWQAHLQKVANREVEYNPDELSSGILDFTILDPTHICQLHDYMYKMGVNHAIIVYVSKKDYSVYVVYVPYIQAIVDFNLEWGRKAIEHRKKLTLPSPIFEVEKGQYEHYNTGDRMTATQNKLLDYPCRKGDKYGTLKYQCKFVRICYDRDRLGKYNGYGYLHELEVVD